MPRGRELDFVISLVPDGALTPRLFELGVGSRVHLGPVRGLFRLDGDDHRDHILIGTGSGIAPLSAMLAELRARREPPRTTLLHGARVRAELAGGVETDEHDRAWFSYQPSLSCALTSDAWRGRTGRVSTSLRNLIAVGDLAPDRTVAYLCGSPGKIDECRSLLAPAGVPPDAVRTERFTAS